MTGAAASGVSEVGQSASVAVVLPPSATPDTRLAQTQSAAAVGLTATAQAGHDAQSTLAAVANAANITATAYMYNIVGTREAATQQSMSATQTALPPMQTQDTWSTQTRATQTQDAITQGMIDKAATRVAEQADAYEVRKNAIWHEDVRQWIYTAGAALVVLLVVAGVYGLFEMGRLYIKAQADGVKAVDRAQADAARTRAEADAAMIYANIERQKERAIEDARERARKRELDELAARNVGADRVEVVDEPDFDRVEDFGATVLEFLVEASKINGWTSDTIPTADELGGNGTRGRVVKALTAKGLIDSKPGPRGYTRLKGEYGTLYELRKAIESGREVFYSPALSDELPVAA